MSKHWFYDLLKDIHGHNFRIDVEIRTHFVENEFNPSKAWLVDDEKLMNIVMAWDNMNVSMHPDFLDKKLRATTENMAIVLLLKLREAQIYTQKVNIRVRVHETDDIYAEANS